MVTVDTNNQDVASPAIRSFQVRLLKVIAGLALISVTIIWLYEANVLHQITIIDRFGYPCFLFSMSAVLIAVTIKAEIYSIAALFAALTFAIYEIVFLQAVFYGFISDIYSVQTFSLWAPLIYVAVFVFLERPKSIIISLLIYTTLLIPNLVRVFFDLTSIRGDPIFYIMLHMICSHPFYITSLMFVENMGRLLIETKDEVSAIKAVADLDFLTQIPNRRVMSVLIEAYLGQDREAGSCFALILLDIDHFKKVNDTYGHDIGDQVLISSAEIIKQNLRAQDVCGRWGGEEFIVVLGKVDLAEAAKLAERLRIAFEKFEHPKVGEVTISLGVTLSCSDDTRESLLQRADKALYQAKAQGRNQVRISK